MSDEARKAISWLLFTFIAVPSIGVLIGNHTVVTVLSVINLYFGWKTGTAINEWFRARRRSKEDSGPQQG